MIFMGDFHYKVGMTSLATMFAIIPITITAQPECDVGLFCKQPATEPMHTHQDEPRPWVPYAELMVQASTGATMIPMYASGKSAI
jgi:hypothetical protein